MTYSEQKTAPTDLTEAHYSHHIRYLSYSIPPVQDGTQVHTLLRHTLQLSASLIKRVKWLNDGITLDGLRVTTRTAVRAGQVLRVRLSDSVRRSEIVPSPGPLDLLYEDVDLLILNKAPGIAVHPGLGHWDDTLGSFLLAYYDRCGIPADFHPVHRLDKGTSGVMAVAKHAHAQDVLRRALHTDAFRREYLAVCDGAPEQAHGVIDLPLAHAGDSVIRQEVCSTGCIAQTEYEVLYRTPERALVRLRLQTGRTHQIRVHMAAIGCPLTGDFLYGRENPALIPRPALHAHTLSLLHPLTGQRLSFTVPLPRDMAALLIPAAAP